MIQNFFKILSGVHNKKKFWLALNIGVTSVLYLLELDKLLRLLKYIGVKNEKN
jgi:hypothetical protein